MPNRDISHLILVCDVCSDMRSAVVVDNKLSPQDTECSNCGSISGIVAVVSPLILIVGGDAYVPKEEEGR
jgi:hypothetical protein